MPADIDPEADDVGLDMPAQIAVEQPIVDAIVQGLDFRRAQKELQMRLSETGSTDDQPALPGGKL